jgi:hypothetical protein
MSTVTDNPATTEINQATSPTEIEKPIRLLPLYHPNLDILLRTNHPNLQRCFYHYASDQSDYTNNKTSELNNCRYSCNGNQNNSCKNYLSMRDILEGRCIWNNQAKAIKSRNEELDELRTICYNCESCTRQNHKVCYEDIKETIRYEEVLGTIGLRRISV